MVRGGSLQEQKRLPVGVYGKRQPDMLGTPLADALIAEAHTFEEKGSDVNLGAHLINDAWRDAFDSAVVITNDTDLATPIRMVSAERRKPVYVVCPGKWVMSTHLERVATYKRHIRRAMLTAAQFPDPIPGTTIRKPANW